MAVHLEMPERDRMTAPIRLAYFGKRKEPLSLFGLRLVLRTPGIDVVSLTCTATAVAAFGPLVDEAVAAGVPILPFDEVRAAQPPDLVLSFSNSLLFRSEFIESVPLGIVNMHPAPLPRFRGSNGIEHCLLERESEFGAVLHYCDSGIDTGPLIAVKMFEVNSDDNARDLWQKVDRVAEKLLTEQLPRLVEAGASGRRLPSSAQATDRAVFYRADQLPARMRVSADRPWDEIVAIVRAYDHPRREPAYMVSGGRRISLGWRQGHNVVLSADEAADIGDMRTAESPDAESGDVWTTWNRLSELEDEYLAISALRTALDLDLFAVVAEQQPDRAELPGILGADPVGTAAIVTAVTGLGLLDVHDGKVGLSAAGRAFLDPASPSYYGDTLRRVTLSADALGGLTEAVRHGVPYGHTGSDSGALWAQDIAPSLVNWPHEVRQATAEWGELGVTPPASGRVVDLGCGSGTRTMALLREHPSVTLELVDWHDEVLEVASQVASMMGIEQRASVRRADLRHIDYEAGSVDLVYTSSVLYFYAIEDLRSLVSRIRRWLKPGGVFVSRHLVLDNDRSGPLEASLRNVQMFLFHPDGNMLTVEQTRATLASAGFVDIEVTRNLYTVARCS